jgi:hypothetical protein
MQRRPVDEQREPDQLGHNQRRNHEQKRARKNRQAETVAQQLHSRTTLGNNM